MGQHLKIQSEKSFNDWDSLYSKGLQGEFPSEMLIRFVNTKLANKPGIKILDLGCGTGRHLSYFMEKNIQVYGIEGSAKAIRIANIWLKSKGLKAVIRHGSALDKNLYEMNNDAVIDVACMQHNLMSDINRIISNVHGSLVKDGYFFSMLKTHDDSSWKQGEMIERSTYKFKSNAEKIDAQVIITFSSLDDVNNMFSCFAHVEIEKEEWTYNNRMNKVSHWVVTARK